MRIVTKFKGKISFCKVVLCLLSFMLLLGQFLKKHLVSTLTKIINYNMKFISNSLA